MEQPGPLAAPEVAALLRAMGSATTAETQALPESLLSWHPAPGEWCVKEVLGHLIEAERRGFAGRIRIILAGDDPDLELRSWDQAAVARERNDCARDLRALLAELAGLRADAVSLVAGLDEADLARGGRHPQVGYLRIDNLLHEWINHDRNHVRQIYANVQAYVWPRMGNAQRFSLP